MFRTRYDRSRVFASAGDPYIDSYKNSVDGDGKIILVISGKDNVYQKIQAERDSCDLKKILARLSTSEIDKFDISHGGLFGDFTQVPKSIHDMRQRLVEADNLFKSLPIEIREEFGFSADRYFSSIGTEFYNNIMSKYIEPEKLKEAYAKTEVKNEEVVANES